ncbi:hypothetical protein R1flu_005021 [Riccia fluitans]|uniref:Uncharacterized protein n=1 Tax=Riccia fluitans TaxID=41844 RepID=A0ABD1YRZ2_9MARC
MNTYSRGVEVSEVVWDGSLSVLRQETGSVYIITGSCRDFGGSDNSRSSHADWGTLLDVMEGTHSWISEKRIILLSYLMLKQVREEAKAVWSRVTRRMAGLTHRKNSSNMQLMFDGKASTGKGGPKDP